MRRAIGQPSTNALREVVDLLVESRIKFEALDNVLKEINPLLHERYLGEIEVVKEHKASALKQALTASLKAKLTQSGALPARNCTSDGNSTSKRDVVSHREPNERRYGNSLAAVESKPVATCRTSE